MPKLVRAHQKIFGNSATTSKIGVFGSFAAGSPATTKSLATIQSLSQYLESWHAAIVGDDSPAIGDMNALFFLITSQLAYLFQAGISEHESGTYYYINSLCTSAGVIYISLTDDNVGNTPSSSASDWKVLVSPSGLQAKTTTYQVLTSDKFVLANATGGAFDVTFPVAANCVGQQFTVKKMDSSANAVTVKTPGAETLESGATYVITERYQFATFVSDGANFWIVSAG